MSIARWKGLGVNFCKRLKKIFTQPFNDYEYDWKITFFSLDKSWLCLKWVSAIGSVQFGHCAFQVIFWQVIIAKCDLNCWWIVNWFCIRMTKTDCGILFVKHYTIWLVIILWLGFLWRLLYSECLLEWRRNIVERGRLVFLCTKGNAQIQNSS